VTENRSGLPWSTIKITLFSFILILLLAIPKIYLSTQIYYTSRIVNDLRQDVTVLESQKEMLADNIELLKYKRDITDMIECEQE